jgi:FkbM family methyltransferase
MSETRTGLGLRARFEEARGHADVRAREVVKALLNYRGQRRAILRRFLFDAVRPFTPSVAVERDGITYFVSTADRVVSRDAFGTGTYSENELAQAITMVETYLGRRPLLEGRTFVDVGANIGTTVIPAVKRFGAAGGIAIEPDPANARLLRCNLVANDLVDRVHCHELALSDRTGTALLERSSFNSGDHRLRVAGQSAPFGGVADGGDVPVRVTTFDDLLRRAGIAIDDIGLVWIDAQGHEARILAGASVLSGSDVPVVIEYWPHGLKLCGGLAPLNQLIAARYRTVIDLRASIAAGRPVLLLPAELPGLAARMIHSGFTDLILLGSPGRGGRAVPIPG